MVATVPGVAAPTSLPEFSISTSIIGPLASPQPISWLQWVANTVTKLMGKQTAATFLYRLNPQDTTRLSGRHYCLVTRMVLGELGGVLYGLLPQESVYCELPQEQKSKAREEDRQLALDALLDDAGVTLDDIAVFMKQEAGDIVPERYVTATCTDPLLQQLVYAVLVVMSQIGKTR